MSEETQNYITYLQEDAIEKINSLDGDAKPNFGIMTAQHMIEHLVKTIKFSIKNYGEAPSEPTEKHLGFKKFIFSDMSFGETKPEKAKLEELKYATLVEAKEGFAEAIDRFFDFFDKNPDAQPYNDFFGALSKAELERFHYKHFKHHFKQFNLE
jgi:oxepin-CoA hydrolase/3-oxo-5,6-dehydrosuberyl-CoA semialdehyde dehydrogenase